MTTSTLSYHSSIGFVHIIPRSSLKLGQVVNGKVLDVKTGDRWTAKYLVLFKPYQKADAVFVQLGDGALLKFDYDAFEYMDGEGGRFAVHLDKCQLVDILPEKVEVEDLYPNVPAFVF